MKPVLLALAGFAVALILLVVIAYQRDMREARARITDGSLAATACGPIEYASLGEGPAVLMVHGAGGGFDQGMGFAGVLASRGFRVIAMSRFGYLRTPLPEDASAEAQADAHACLLDALGIGSASLVGASAGAPSSLQFALRHPQRTQKLVLLVPALYTPRPGGAPPLETPEATPVLFDSALRWDFLFWAASRLARETFYQGILATPPAVIAEANAEERARVEAMLDSILPVSERRLGLLNDAAVTSTLSRYRLEEVRAPVLLISARDDGFGTWEAARYSAGRIPDARFLGFERGGHVWVGHNEEVVEAIADFLAE